MTTERLSRVWRVLMAIPGFAILAALLPLAVFVTVWASLALHVEALTALYAAIAGLDAGGLVGLASVALALARRDGQL